MQRRPNRSWAQLLVVWSFLLTTLAPLAAHSGDQPYAEGQDAKAEVRQALTHAADSHKPVLLIFGANWCEDCQALDRALRASANAELLAREFQVVKINVGNFDRNQDIVTTYGNPTKSGIPAAVILSADSRVLYATRAGELADARRMSEDGIHAFFKRALERTQPDH